jgi:hypothetical protein
MYYIYNYMYMDIGIDTSPLPSCTHTPRTIAGDAALTPPAILRHVHLRAPLPTHELQARVPAVPSHVPRPQPRAVGGPGRGGAPSGCEQVRVAAKQAVSSRALDRDSMLS